MQNKTKNILIIILSSALIIAIIAIFILLFNNKETSQNLELQGKVIIVGEDYLIIESNNIDYLINNSKGTYKEGDIIKIYYNETDLNNKSNPKSVKITDEELIERTKEDSESSNNINSDIQDNNQDNSQSSNQNNPSTKPNPSNNASSNSNSATTNQPNNNNSNTNNSSVSSNNSNNSTSSTNADTEVLNYFNSINNDFSAGTIKESLKSNFIIIVDFLFYNGKIKGYTFSELSNSAKLKVLSMALYFDSKIENYFPGYKENISNTTSKIYTNIKEKIVTAYLNITTSICSNNTEACLSAKEGFNELKTNFGLTWSLIKDIAGDGLANLKNWYEIWSGK